MKTKNFQVGERAGEVMNWALGIALAAYALTFLDNFLYPPSDGQEPMVQLFASAVSPNILNVVETVLKLCGTLVVMENFRRCLSRSSHYFLQLATLLIMVLSTLLAIVQSLPDGTVMDSDGTVRQTALGIFQNRFYFWDNVVIFLGQLFLGIGLATRFAGRIRLYGLSLFGAPIVGWLCSFAVYYVYTEVPGSTMSTVNMLLSLNNYASVVLSVLPLVLMRAAMQNSDEA